MTAGPLQYLCVGAGRDGTLTAAGYITDILRAAGMAGECAHEMHSRVLYELQCDLAERPEQAGTRQALRDTIAGFPCAAASGTGYAGVLPVFAELYPDLRLIHLKRRDKAAFIASQIRNSGLYPETYVYYSTESGVMRRISAFHTGEASREQWQALPLSDKFAWFYDYTHRSVAAAYRLFPAVLQLDTEDLGRAETLRRLTSFVAGEAAEPPTPRRLNGHALIHIHDFPAEQRAFAQWLFGRLPSQALTENNTVVVDHVLNAAIAWLGYLQTGFAAQLDARYARPPEQVRREAQALLSRLDFYRSEVARFIAEMNLR